MYRKLQQQVKEYIIDSLSELSDEWWFDIDTSNRDNPIIVAYGPENSTIEAPIEELHHYTIKEFKAALWNKYKINGNDADNWLGCLLIRQLVSNVFKIYGIKMKQPYEGSVTMYIVKKDRAKTIISYVCYNKKGYVHYTSPFSDPEIAEYIPKEKLVSSLLLLLDPISYFRQYSIIIKKYPRLIDGHTLGIYELLLEYFPEMNDQLFARYLPLQYIFQDKCVDIVGVIGGILIELYV